MSTRIERCADQLVTSGLALTGIVADAQVDGDEVKQLADIGDQILRVAVEVEDLALDIATAKQVLTLGRGETPNRVLRDRDSRIELLKSLHASGKKKAPERVAVAGSRMAG